MTEPSMPQPGTAPARIDSGQPDQQAAPAAPAAAPAAPAAAPPVPAEPPADGPGLSADEEARLGELLAKRDAAAAQQPVRLRVTSEHESISYGGLTITTDYTEVPAHMVAAMSTAAAEAGVQIEQES